MRRIVHATNCPCDELSMRRIVHATNCPCDELSMRRIVHATNCPCDELSMRELSMRRIVRIVRDELSVTNCPCDGLSGRRDILHWFNTFYVVPSSTAIITTSRWLEQYHSSQWATFEEFTKWQTSCWLVSPLTSFTYPIGRKQYTCKHSVGLDIMFNMYQVMEKTRCEPLGIRKGKGHPKNVRTALLL